jgi:malonyl-CoA O-methyltransferase
MKAANSTARRFSCAAKKYEQEAALHRRVAERLMPLLPNSQPKVILELGCGTGFLTRLLCEKYGEAHIDAVDFAPGMVEQTAMLVKSERVHVHLADARKFSSSRDYDMVVSASSLQWMRPFGQLFSRIRTLLKPNGVFAFALFGEGTFRELRELRAEIAPDKGFLNSMPSAPELKAALIQNGFTNVMVTEATLRDNAPCARTLLRRIKRLGFTGGNLSNARGRLTRRELEDLVSRYDRMNSLSGQGVVATFRAVFVVTVCDSQS